MLAEIRRKLVYYKIYLSRSLAYISIVNSVMILFLTLSDLKDYGIKINLTTWFIPILILGTAGLIFAGWLEKKVGVLSEELQIRSELTPQFPEILKRLERIETQIKQQNNKK